jgi:hypothetical protein
MKLGRCSPNRPGVSESLHHSESPKSLGPLTLEPVKHANIRVASPRVNPCRKHRLLGAYNAGAGRNLGSGSSEFWKST